MGVTRMEGSKITSKTSSLKALLLKAWRERWSDLQWGIHIKTILPRGVSGDVYNLADCILQQALVGSGPNHLVLSYLKHSLSTQLVSYAAVLQRIAKYDGFHKPHCVSCLLELVESIQSGITCRGKPEEGILASAVLSLAHWLLQCYQHAAVADSDGPMLTKPPVILNHMLSCQFLRAMLTLAKYDEPDIFEEVVKKCQEISNFHQMEEMPTSPALIQDSIVKLCCLGKTESSDKTEALTYILQPMLAVLIMLNPCIDTLQLTNQIKLVAKLKGFSDSRTVCEVMRASLMNLYDALGTCEGSKWGAFTFLKLPHIISQLGLSDEVVSAGVDELMEFGPLIEQVECAESSKSLEALLTELVKMKLIPQQRLNAYLASKESSNSQQPTSQTPTQLPMPKIIIRAQTTLQRVFQTIHADHSKIQEALPSVLCQVLTGKSFELILAVASVEGKLQSFVIKLIRFNEFSKAGSTTRPVLFDITFLMLSYIVQVYGSKVVFPGGRKKEDSFFEHWSSECLVERGEPKCPDSILSCSDPATVDTLLNLLNASQPPDYVSCGLSWDAICLSIPGVMKEVLVAWEQGALSATDVKRILDNLKHNMCSLPICAAAWLCTYMQILHHDALLKPMNMVQQLLFVSGSASGGSEGGESLSQDSPATPPPPPDNYRERASLMAQVIKKIQYDMHLVAYSKPKPLSHGIICKEPLSEVLVKVWSETVATGWLSIQSTRQLESLFYTAGAEWLVTNTISEVAKLRYKSEIDKAVDITTAIFHLDIETCTQVLLNTLLPDYLHVATLRQELVEPVSECLARISVYCLYSALELQTNKTRKRSSSTTEDDGVVSKLARLEDEVACMFEETSSNKPSFTNGKVSDSVGRLLKLFNNLIESATYLSQATHFIFTFLKLLTLCNPNNPSILHLIPPTLIRGLVKLVPDLFSEELLLSLYDVSSPSGRKSAASDLCLLRNIQLKPPL